MNLSAQALVRHLLEAERLPTNPKDLLDRLLVVPGLVQPSGEATREDATEANALLRKFFRAKGREKWLEQYEWILTGVSRSGWGDTATYQFEYWPRGGEKAQAKSAYSNREREVRQFRTPKAAVADWEAHVAAVQLDQYAYRGMNMAEWVQARRQGFIKSSGRMNLASGSFPSRESYTSFGKWFSTAHSYAGAFAAYYDEPTRRSPGVIVAVPIELTQDADRLGVGTKNERVAERVPIDQVAGVWILTPVEAGPGYFALIRKSNGWLEDGSRSSPTVRYAVVPKSGIALTGVGRQ